MSTLELSSGHGHDMMHVPSHPDMLTEKELESVTTVFRSFESGLRGATIDPSVSSVDMYIQIIQIYLDCPHN